MMKEAVVGCAVAATSMCASSASAGFVGLTSSFAFIDGKSVCRLYAQFNSADDVVLSCFGVGGMAGIDWYDNDFVGGSFAPQFTIDPLTDTYVTIGGAPGFTNSTNADPAWGGAGFSQPGIPNGAGWFNANPPNLQGKVDGSLKTLLAQFSVDQPTFVPTIALTIAFNQGLGTPTMFSSPQTHSLCFPTPAAFPLIGAMALANRRRGRR